MPQVSVIVPCFNEQATICMLLDALLAQDFPRAQMEIIIADGLSTDQTRLQIESFGRQHPDLAVRVVDNPQRNIPAGVNRALEAAGGEFIVRLDAHSMPDPAYVSTCVRLLQTGAGDNVGGVWEIRPGAAGWQAHGIAAAAAHPLGVGDALYRFSSRAQAVDTVPFGAFRRNLIERVGLFDETLLTNEDYEFNTRVRQSGGRVWLDPAIRSVYFARPSLPALARQYWRYGYWKLRMLQRYPKTIRWRQALPPLFVLSVLALSILALILPAARLLLVVELCTYSGILLLVGAQVALKKKEIGLLLGVPLAIAVMHISWGGAFLWSMIERRKA